MNTQPDDDMAAAELEAAMEDMRQAQERLYRVHTAYHGPRWKRCAANGKAIHTIGEPALQIVDRDATRC